MSHTPKDAEFTPLNIAVLTVSDTRTINTDTSGQALIERLESAGHQLAARQIVIDDVYEMRAIASKWIVDPEIHVIISTGGTGFAGRDSTPEAMQPLFDKTIEGFGELFRQISAQQIGTSTIQSRALGAWQMVQLFSVCQDPLVLVGRVGMMLFLINWIAAIDPVTLSLCS